MRRERISQQILAGAGACVMLSLLGSIPAASQNDEPTNSVAGGILSTYPSPEAQGRKAKRAGGSGQMQQFRLQQNMDRQQKAATIRSNAAKKNERTKKGVLRNMQ